MITAIVIPADYELPLRQEQMNPHDLTAYRQLVHGNLEAVRLERPAASLYLNEEGKLDGLPLNARATAVAWAHNSALRGFDPIVGDVFLVGPVDENGDDLTVPGELVHLIFEARHFRVEVQVHSSDSWLTNGLVFDQVFSAYGAGIDLALRWMQVKEVQVVELR